ncbi:MAG: MBG domain-containing protein [Patescibacteria group bacterium]
MKNLTRALGLSVLFFSLVLSASASVIADPDSPTTPQPFTFYCQPYSEPFVSGQEYVPTQNGFCTYTVPQTAPFKVVELYKGTVGNATPVLVGFNQGPASTLRTSPNSFGTPAHGDDFFAAAYGASSDDDMILGSIYLQAGAGLPPPPDLTILAWKWGVPPTPPTPTDTTAPDVFINTPIHGSTYLTTATVFIDATISDASPIAETHYFFNGTEVNGGLALDLASATLGAATASVTAVDTANNSGSASVQFTIKKALTVVADEQSTVYGSALPPLTATLSGFIGGETLATSGVAGSPSCTTTASAGSPAGDYPISCTAGTLASGRYAFTTYVAGVLHITPAPLTVTANDATAILGGALPAFGSTLSGFVNGETLATSDVTGEAACTAGSTAAVGSYPITCTQGTLASNNYSFAFTPGTLRVNYRWDGFLQPINDTAHQINPDVSVFKGGSTVPVKLQFKDANGNIITTAAAPVWLMPQKGAAMVDPVDELFYSDPITSGSVFELSGDHYKYNWGTKGLQTGFWYRIYVLLPDFTIRTVVIGLR